MGIVSVGVISVTCASAPELHLAPKVPGMGVSRYTLCLRKWKEREPCREDSRFCAECLRKLDAKSLA